MSLFPRRTVSDTTLRHPLLQRRSMIFPSLFSTFDKQRKKKTHGSPLIPNYRADVEFTLQSMETIPNLWKAIDPRFCSMYWKGRWRRNNIKTYSSLSSSRQHRRRFHPRSSFVAQIKALYRPHCDHPSYSCHVFRCIIQWHSPEGLSRRLGCVCLEAMQTEIDARGWETWFRVPKTI